MSKCRSPTTWRTVFILLASRRCTGTLRFLAASSQKHVCFIPELHACSVAPKHLVRGSCSSSRRTSFIFLQSSTHTQYKISPTQYLHVSSTDMFASLRLHANRFFLQPHADLRGPCVAFLVATRTAASFSCC